MFKQFILSEDGQTATEYMLLISVIVIGVVSLAWGFSDGFKAGVAELGSDVKSILGSGKIAGSGLPRDGGGGGGAS